MDKDATPQSAAAKALEAFEDDSPNQSLPLSIRLVDQLDRAKKLEELLERSIEEALDLLPSQVAAMRAVRAGSGTLDELTASLGLVQGTAELIIESLADRDLAILAPDGSLGLTESGNAMLDRAEGIRLRVADLASSRLSEHQVKRLADAVSGMQELSSARLLPRA